jgi:hypothetical protein
MTLLDLIKLKVIASDRQAEKFAEDLIDRWHSDMIPGALNDILGLTAREYQAWATGGVSLLTIAHWQKTSHPPLQSDKPWFKLSGAPGRETVGYLEDKLKQNGAGPSERRGLKKKQPS